MKNKHTIQHLPYYIDETVDRNHYFENHWKRVALDLLQKHVGSLQGVTLLDYGCGRGETLKYATDRGMIAEGLDTDQECVAIASKFGKVQQLDTDKRAEQLRVNSYDVVACFHVLEHVDNPKQVLGMLGRAARSYVLTAVPNLQKIPNLRKPWAPPKPTNAGHLQSWDHSHFRNLAEQHCGLRLVAWGFDATQVPVFSELLNRCLGPKAAIKFETGLFKRLFPYWGISVIALWEPTEA